MTVNQNKSRIEKRNMDTLALRPSDKACNVAGAHYRKAFGLEQYKSRAVRSGAAAQRVWLTYSTVTLLARLRGLSTSQPRKMATW